MKNFSEKTVKNISICFLLLFLLLFISPQHDQAIFLVSGTPHV